MSIVNTGNYSVDAIADMNISGNVTPINWYKTILRENGKPYLLAICILSEIVYWYRPVEVRDERSGMCCGYRTRFKDDMLRKSYSDMAEQFGESKRSVKAAMDRLACLGIINREFRTVTLSNGTILNNVMYIDLCIEKLYEYTYTIPDNIVSPDDEGISWNQDDEEMVIPPSPEVSNGSEVRSVHDVVDDCSIVTPTVTSEMSGNTPINGASVPSYKTLYHPPTKFCTTLPQNSVPPSYKTLYHPPTEFCRTNIENTTENTNEINTSYQSNLCRGYTDGYIPTGEERTEMDEWHRLRTETDERMDETRQLIRDNIDYDCLVSDVGRSRKAQLDELIELMTEEIVLIGGDLTISGRNYPKEVVRSIFEKYNMETMKYVIDTINSNTTEVRNVRKYLLAALLNAPKTMSSHYQMQVNHDFSDDNNVRRL